MKMESTKEKYPDIFSLKEKVALITGANKGLGRSMALGLAEAGADIAIVDRESTNSDAISKEVGNLGHGCFFLTGDVSDDKSVDNFISKISDHYGRLDILINNAAIAGAGSLEELEAKTWRKVIDVNLTGTFLCCKRVVTEMKKIKGGCIINIASIYGHVGTFHELPASAYCAAKGGVINLTRQLAIELAPLNIRVNAIAPGWHDTEMNKGMLDNDMLFKIIMDRTPLKRIGNPNEIKGAVIFLASDASKMVTGHILNVDAGWLAW
jgi:NAD(P)-dependent dehydrogenase (short-subunit alcohol dehydrogenase family)